MQSRDQRMHHVVQNKGLRTELSDYDESLLLDRSYVHMPADGFEDEEEGAIAGEAEGGTGPICSTALAVSCYWACVVAYTVFLFIPIYDSELDDFEVKASAHILLLLLALALEGYLRLQHRRRQAAGYLAFYWRTRGLLSNPMRITALGQGLVTMVAFWPDIPPRPGVLAKLQAITCAEALVMTCFAAAYARQFWRHSREAAPDAQLYLRTSLYSGPGSALRGPDAVVEHQAEALRWLSRRCHTLQREVLRLSLARDRDVEAAAGGAEAGGRADLEHRLGARERELRALAAEKEALAEQARAAWALLDERLRTAIAQDRAEMPEAVSAAQVVKQQQVKENARLRATLEEWSHRNVKLEARLNRTRGRLEDALAQVAELRGAPGGANTGSRAPSGSTPSPSSGSASREEA